MTDLRAALRRSLESLLARPGRTALAAFGLGLGAAAVFELVGALDPEVRARRLEAPRIPIFTADARARALPVVALAAGELRRAGLALAEGRTFADLDARDARRVAVLGAAARAELFDAGPALAESVEIAGERFVVIGVLAPGAAHAREGVLDSAVLVPASAAPEALASALAAGAPRGGGVELGARSLLAASCLLLGGAVLASAMLATALERAGEVAMRRLVGATRREVFRELWLEALLQALVAGAAGVAAGQGLHALGVGLAGPAAPGSSAWGPPLALATTLAIGAAAGFFPAHRAAQRDPTRALRGE